MHQFERTKEERGQGQRRSKLPDDVLEYAAAEGIDVKEMLAGAALIDEEIRIPVLRNNPAALLAYLAMRWYWIGSCRIEYCS
ncbi:glucose-6-phosphate isomerase-like isoform X2 [Chenopodium quinoa]|uniref:glucose-6-phosphate isomerase-like isoform X2 n=1 Tax=Chenopodium quinoa TaxID=63459 RepID=UPI000B76F697|nr:glucose-6-phosphate isomerase-like isoform X2 [Chenopodium quinoa]